MDLSQAQHIYDDTITIGAVMAACEHGWLGVQYWHANSNLRPESPPHAYAELTFLSDLFSKENNNDDDDQQKRCYNYATPYRSTDNAHCIAVSLACIQW